MTQPNPNESHDCGNQVRSEAACPKCGADFWDHRDANGDRHWNCYSRRNEITGDVSFQSKECRIAELELRLAEVTAERDQARKAVSFGRDPESFDWAVLGKIDELERRLAEEVKRHDMSLRGYTISQEDWEDKMKAAVADRDSAIQRAEAAEADFGAIREAYVRALNRMDRARAVLTDDNPRPECNWGILDTEAEWDRLSRPNPGQPRLDELRRLRECRQIVSSVVSNAGKYVSAETIIELLQGILASLDAPEAKS